ncbi:hypothetical protein [uncultured Parasphingorhabdus sp.]|uniref:hypothetical protein n=1 Tax=uncultured Parasphingorhabdus sp. TaxID=2709694 RepID=UPI00374A46F3
MPLEILRKYRFGYCPPEGTALKYALYALGKSDKDLGIFQRLPPFQTDRPEELRILLRTDHFCRRGLAQPAHLCLWPIAAGHQLHNKYLGLALFQKPVFGLAALASTGPVLLMEGPINAMIASYWGFNAVALTGTNPSPAHLEEIESRIVKNHRRLVPVIDNDEAGSVSIVKWREFIPQMEEPSCCRPR